MSGSKWSEVMRCLHCNNHGLMHIIADVEDQLGYPDENLGPNGEEYWVNQGINCYQLLICQACNKPLPLRIAKALDEAERVRGVSANGACR